MGTDSMGRSVMFRPIRARTPPRSGSRLRRKAIQSAIGFVRDGCVWELFFDLLINAGGLLRIGLAEQARKFEQDQRARHERGRFICQGAVDLDGLLGLAGTRINRSEEHTSELQSHVNL